MDKRLRSLRQSMKKTVFSELNFTEKMHREIRKKITEDISDEDLLLAVMQLLAAEKTGFDLSRSIRSRGIRKFHENEGDLYTMLHELESKGWLKSRWDNESRKHYQLNAKGRKQLQKLEKKSAAPSLKWNEQPEG
ncbi:PadR family transcriptional regulator [Bacillus sp. FJAT-42376]|uniref:PadR family transcriptional regulator n=1 Tax=Bacillus sp. FJAT-42376 TaxID=2014076 RepID=UPI000F512CE3|nr:PadR family transcriptional regulator [Bacillus sp. FJAT-42376]AZB41932.1 PadR family transcriptional regulator [Bacillus sp. FJAT-42376]